ncbi:MAG: YbhB/YbcL family Raf kinase inhibitor-like protein, partial [Dehalococcoidales bacterium]|nr:YbhB/YbcL family Raf kinase inhibitor-like protein [Dehalococcoidales bacterium]
PTETPEPTVEPTEEPTEEPPAPMALTSSVFAAGESIPGRYSGTISPPLSWENAPAGTLSFVLIMDDPDAIPVAGYVWDHWIVYDIAADVTMLAEGAGAAGGANLPAGAKHGRNSWGENFYGGPSPPSGSHEYVFKLYALDIAELNPGGTTKAAIEAAMEGHLLAQAELRGMYP